MHPVGDCDECAADLERFYAEGGDPLEIITLMHYDEDDEEAEEYIGEEADDDAVWDLMYVTPARTIDTIKVRDGLL